MLSRSIFLKDQTPQLQTENMSSSAKLGISPEKALEITSNLNFNNSHHLAQFALKVNQIVTENISQEQVDDKFEFLQEKLRQQLLIVAKVRQESVDLVHSLVDEMVNAPRRVFQDIVELIDVEQEQTMLKDEFKVDEFKVEEMKRYERLVDELSRKIEASRCVLKDISI